MRLRVIGIGSRFGDDAAGLVVAERLRRCGLPGAPEILARERPGLGLLDDLGGVAGAVLVDAMRGGGVPGTVRILAPDDLAQAPRLSSHEFGVAESLALAEALGRRLPLLRLVGVEAGAPGRSALSAAVRGALPEACAAVRRALAEVATALGQVRLPASAMKGGRGSSGVGELL